MAETRIERDSMGAIEVPADAFYGAQTERARRNFPISGAPMPDRLIRALVLIKAEAAAVNQELGLLEPRLANAIREAAEIVLEQPLARDFPVDVYQTGSGTSTNMNANEVLANRANELLGAALGSRSPVHPNDHVNLGQSSNDVMPSALHVAAYSAVVEELVPALEGLARTIELKASELDDVVKVGRTHLQDAVPLRVGQELSGHASQVRNGIARLNAALPRVAELALGGTAVGTGLNSAPGFAAAVVLRLAQCTGHRFVVCANRFEALSARDAAVELSAATRGVAVSLTKIANDVRWAASGPRCGLGELAIPSVQPGSSIMPGKVNPVIPEALLMVAARVVGNDATIAWAGASGSFQLNVMVPVIAHTLLESVSLLAKASTVFMEHCIAGLDADRDRLRETVERSLALVTALAPELGYDRAAGIAKRAFEEDLTVREAARRYSDLAPDEIDRLLDLRAMTEGHTARSDE